LPAHGKGRNASFGAGAVSCFSLPCASPWRTAKKVHRALSEEAHGNGSLPCKLLPCALCRAPRRKTHGKNFAVRFWAFAVAHGKPPVSRSACIFCFGSLILRFVNYISHHPSNDITSRWHHTCWIVLFWALICRTHHLIWYTVSPFSTGSAIDHSMYVLCWLANATTFNSSCTLVTLMCNLICNSTWFCSLK
jgi:hypothetical protein